MWPVWELDRAEAELGLVGTQLWPVRDQEPCYFPAQRLLTL